MIVNREHTLTLPGDEVELMILTNAEEAEDELPEEIHTKRRDIGTFREATILWRGRSVTSVVSARLKAGVATVTAEIEQPPAVTPALLRRFEEVLKCGILIRNAPLTDDLTPDETLLANLLIAGHRGRDGGCLTLREIGAALNVSDETIRRRKSALLDAHPRLRTVISSYRSRHARGTSLAFLTASLRADDEPPGDE